MRVYIVTECNRSDVNYIYPYAYSTYASALSAVQEKYPREFEESKEADKAHDLYGVEEDESGTTKLYIEKGIYIKVSKLLVVL